MTGGESVGPAVGEAAGQGLESMLSSGELLRNVLSLVSGRVFLVGRDGTLRPVLEQEGWDTAAASAAGAGRHVQEVYGRTPRARAELERLLSGAAEEVRFSLELEAELHDVRVRALRGAGQQWLGALGLAAPAPERAELQRALQASESRLHQVFDSNMVGMAFWERGGAITRANDALLQLLGYSREELASGQLDWKSLTPPEYLARDETALREIDERGVCTPFEKEYIRKDGRRVPILIGGASFDAERGSGVCFMIDESARKEQEQLRRGAEAQLRHAVNCTPFVLWSVDAQGVFTLSEGRGLAALGLRPGEVVGRSALEFYQDVPQILEGLRRGLSGGDFTEVVELSGRIFETRTFHLTSAEGRQEGLVALSLDITERQRAEEERMRLQAKLREVQRLESLGLMAGGIAHDFNNILTVILGNACTALLALPPGSESRSDIDHVIAAARRASDLTRQMLAYAGRGRFEVRSLDLSEHVRELANLLATTIPSKVQLQLELDPVPAISADPAQLQQVIMNLVINGAEAIGEGSGKLRVRTGEQPLDPASARALLAADELPAGRYVFLEVQDSGVGMDAATVARIFDPFFTTKFTGRGLGLAAVLGIVRAHQGAIRVDSNLGRGSTFTVFLPSSRRASERALPAARGAGQGLVLLVDDDENVRRTIKKMLVARGFSVMEAANGRLALRAFEQHSDAFQFVLLDLTMPEMDGEQALRAIRRLSAVPVVLMSGYGEVEAARRFAGDGPSSFLQKPFTSEQLAQKLSLVLAPSSGTLLPDD